MDKNLETGLLIGAGLGLALAPIVKKIAKSLPHLPQQMQQVIEGESNEKHEPQHDGTQEDSEARFIPALAISEDDNV